jgi:hypothetical protein
MTIAKTKRTKKEYSLNRSLTNLIQKGQENLEQIRKINAMIQN